MSVEFSNAYQEILLDNLMSIIKQNFIFQTQLKLVEDVGKQKAEIEKKYNELNAKYGSMESQLHEAESYKAKVISDNSAHQEKQRIQIALNDTMKKNVGLNKQLEEKDLEIKKLKDYIQKLEEIAPVSKLKKINPEKKIELPAIEESAPVDLFAIKANDGSSF